MFSSFSSLVQRYTIHDRRKQPRKREESKGFRITGNAKFLGLDIINFKKSYRFKSVVKIN
jgi:hypothetical protein